MNDQRTNNRQRQLLLGIFFILALSILAFYTLFLTDMHVFSKPILMTVYFPDANGLREGDPVQVLGARIGRVKELAFDTVAEPKKRIRTVLSMEREIELLEGASITIRESSFLGGRNVDINPGTFGGPPLEALEDGAYYGSVFKNPISMLADIGVLLNENRASINSFLSNLDTITTDIRTGKGMFGKFIEDPEMGENAKSFVANLTDTSSALKEGRGLLGSLIYDPSSKQKFVDALDRLQKIGDDLENQKGVLGALIYDATLRDKLTQGIDAFSSVGQRIDRGEGALGRLISDEKLGQQLDVVMGNLQTVSEDLKTITAQVKGGEGTLGKLLVSDEMYQELRRTLGVLNRSLEDYREAAPITAFTTVLFAAF